MSEALVIGASGGIGSAVADEMVARGARVVRLSRRMDGLDVTDPASVARVLGALRGPFRTVFVGFGVLGTPEKRLADIDAAEMAQVLAVNTIGVGLVLRHLPQLLPGDGRSVTGVLTARVGSIGDNRMGGWHAYRASKAAANQLVRGAAIELRRSHKGAILAALHPGTVETTFTARYPGHRKVMAAEAAGNLVDVMAGLTRDQSGGFFDYAAAEIPW